MSTLFSILLGLVIFCMIILFHELGHLLLAKKNGIDVPEFSLGFGPRLCGFKKNGTDYCIRLIWFGGSCRMLGQDGETTEGNSFAAKGPWVRFTTLFAGPFFNIVLAFILAVVVIGLIGYDPCTVTKVTADGAAAEAGLEPGDLISSFNGKSISIGRELAAYLQFHELNGDSIPVTYIRGEEEYSASINPVLTRSYKLGFYYNASDTEAEITDLVSGGVLEKAGVKSGDVIIEFNGSKIASGKELYEFILDNPLDGSQMTLKLLRKGKELPTLTLIPEYTESFELGFNYNFNYRSKTDPIKVLKYSFVEVGYQISNTVQSLKLLFTGKLSSNDVGGPVRIVSELENTVQESKKDGLLYVVVNLLNWAILLSANLGIMNLLPIPGLDGGRLIFVIIELVRGKPVPAEKEGIVTGIGFVILILLMIFIFFNDIRYVFF